MSLRERGAPLNTEFDALIRQAVRAGAVHRKPAADVRRQLMQRASEQRGRVQPRLPGLSLLEWLDSFLSSDSVSNYRPQSMELSLNNFYLMGAYRINWRWCL